jgi:hypothetical protein
VEAGVIARVAKTLARVPVAVTVGVGVWVDGVVVRRGVPTRVCVARGVPLDSGWKGVRLAAGEEVADAWGVFRRGN